MQADLMEWDENLKTGIDFVDSQHRELFAIVNSLNAGLREGREREEMRDLLRRLHEYAHLHFHQEEAMMERAGYPGLAGHRIRHASFIEHVERFQTAFEREEPIGAPVLNFLRDWITCHIRGTDRRYLPYVNT